MKTSNKLLTGMYLFVIVLILVSFFISTKYAKDHRNNLIRETLIIDTRIDSLILNNSSHSKVKITVGDRLLVKYIKSTSFKSDRIENSLYIDCAVSLDIEIPDSITYIYVYAKECNLFDFDQDSLSLVGLNLKNFVINNSEIKVLNINSKSSRFKLKDTNIEHLSVELKDYSVLQKSNNSIVKQITGLVDSTSTINVTGINKINLENKNNNLFNITTNN